jgi:anti-sigma regulatory factor (Ser/Thr protein kinase)
MTSFVRSTLVASMPNGLVVEIREEVGHTVLRLSGQLSLRTVPRVREAAVKSLLGIGRVVINLSSLRSPQTAFVAVFPAALAAAGGWPLARLSMFGADAGMRSMLVSTRTVETVPLAADLAAALAILEQRPPEVRRHRDLPMHGTAARAARLLVREACDAWLVPQAVQEIAELVSTELVSNAVEHAHSSSRFTLTCTRSALRLSVRDYRPTSVPRPRPIDVESQRGRGLHLVACLAQAWGVEQHPDGKTVWVSLPLDYCPA